jgi:hypothetical protein
VIHLRIPRFAPVHSGKLERWLGADQVRNISIAMGGGNGAPRWYGPPIGVSLTPGRVYAAPDGDFYGRLGGGSFMNLTEWSIQRAVSRFRRIVRKTVRGLSVTLNTGFASLGDLISEAAAGKSVRFQFNKVGPTGVANVTSGLWRLGNQPAAGAAPAAAAAGTAFTSASTGAFPYTNPTNPDSLHFLAGFPNGSVAGHTLLLYDQLFGVAKTMNSTATEAVTGVPTRYQNNTGGQADSIGGNFLFVIVGGTALAATAHNWTVCQYTDDAGNATQTLPSLTGNASAIVDRLDHPVMQWFAPLAAGDIGIKLLTQMQCSALVATGVIWFMIGHPIAWMPCPIASMTCPTDAIRGAFQLTRIFDSACLAFLEVNKPVTTAATYSGEIIACAG